MAGQAELESHDSEDSINTSQESPVESAGPQTSLYLDLLKWVTEEQPL